MPAAPHRHSCLLGILILSLAAAGPVAAAADPAAIAGPVAAHFPLREASTLPEFAALAVDPQAAREEDREREAQGLPPRFALPQTVAITPEHAGLWERLDDHWWLWRLRISAPGATSLNFGFTRYRLPAGGRLTIHPRDAREPDDHRGVRVFSDADNEAHGELWTPVVLADDVVIELLLPLAARHDYRLELTSVNRGYRFFDELLVQSAPDKAGSCNIDVACPEGDPWRAEAAAVGAISLGGSVFCTGFMVNNTAQDGTPYFMTANHCNIRLNNAPSLVVYWNFRSPSCGQQGGGTLTDFQTGATYLTAAATSDFTLVLLDDPVDPDHGVAFAGWDNSGEDVRGVTAIHHPGGDEQSISFDADPTAITSYLGTDVPGDETHIRVVDWDLGTTEPGSSGSPLFDANHRVVGQLHGGYAACGNDASDWYGRFAVSWQWLAVHLDPLGTGAATCDTWVPHASGLELAPGAFVAHGPSGGPFTVSGSTWTLSNPRDLVVDYVAVVDVPWVDVTRVSGTLAPGAAIDLEVVPNAAAATMPFGDHRGTLSVATSAGSGTATRELTLRVGLAAPQLVFNLDEDPGWATDTGWAWGAPSGGGGLPNGNPDPMAGYTGTHVYGFELAGDYEPALPALQLTTTPLDCRDLTDVTLRFRRWLNVEANWYDQAAIAVSSDGQTWTEVWHNGEDDITDAEWVPVTYDISAVADGQAAVQIRWTMGPTDYDWQFSGWNLDDVEIWGRRAPVAGAPDLPQPRLVVGNHPNPFNPTTRITFTLDRDGPVELAVYDLRGRRVRRLVSARLAAGDHATVWDGADDDGRRAGSGVYLARLSAGGRTVHHKMTMLK